MLGRTSTARAISAQRQLRLQAHFLTYGRFLFVLCMAGQADLTADCHRARHVATRPWLAGVTLTGGCDPYWWV